MVIRNKSGLFLVSSATVLLEFLGVKKEAEGVHRVTGDVELVASVPFIKEQRAESKEQSPEGVPWVLSTFDLDRFGERVDPQGWDFSRYMKNPVVEWAHRYDIPAIGKIEGLAVDGSGLHGFVVFNDKSFDPFGWGIGERVKAGVIRAGSVGFRVTEIEIPSKEDSKDGTSLIFRKQELLEFSICNVPANPWALAKSNEQGTESKEQRAESKEGGILTNQFWGLIQINNEQ